MKSCASAHDASRDSVPSARLVRMTGTRAPRTMPADSASAQVDQLLGDHVSRLQVGRHQYVGVSGHIRDDVLGFRRSLGDRIVEGQGAIQKAAGDLAAVRHLAQRGGIHRRGDLRVDRFHGREHGNLRLVDAKGAH